MFTKLGLQVYTVRDHIKDEASMDATFAKLAELVVSRLLLVVENYLASVLFFLYKTQASVNSLPS